MKKNFITGIVIGVLATVCAAHIWALYSLRKEVSTDTATLQTVVRFINDSIAAQQKTSK